MNGSWKKPGYSKQVSTVYVVGVSANELVRRMFEDGFARHVETFGVVGVSSYKDLIYADEDQEEGIKEKIIKEKAVTHNADTVLITRMTGRRTEVIVEPGRVWGYSSGPGYGAGRYINTRRNVRTDTGYRSNYYGRARFEQSLGLAYQPGGYYRGLGDYYNRSVNIVYEPATTSYVEIVTIEVVLFSRDLEAMVWGAEIETYGGYPLGVVVDDFIETVVEDLDEKGLI